MATFTGIFPHRRIGKTPLDKERSQLYSALEETRALIQQAYGGFNITTDPDLIEAYVYEISAHQSRYSYLLRQLKALEVSP